MSETMVPIFRVADGVEAAKWYGRLGFKVRGEHRFEPGFPLYSFLQRGLVWLHLSEHTGDAPPHSLVYFYVDNLDEVAAEFGVEVDTQPWGREVDLVDPDGNRLRLSEGLSDVFPD